jgi:hypothetical protein
LSHDVTNVVARRVDAGKINGREIRRGIREPKRYQRPSAEQKKHVAICGRLRACVAAQDQRRARDDGQAKWCAGTNNTWARRPIKRGEVSNRLFCDAAFDVVHPARSGACIALSKPARDMEKWRGVDKRKIERTWGLFSWGVCGSGRLGR